MGGVFTRVHLLVWKAAAVLRRRDDPDGCWLGEGRCGFLEPYNS